MGGMNLEAAGHLRGPIMRQGTMKLMATCQDSIIRGWGNVTRGPHYGGGAMKLEAIGHL